MVGPGCLGQWNGEIASCLKGLLQLASPGWRRRGLDTTGQANKGLDIWYHVVTLLYSMLPNQCQVSSNLRSFS